MNYKFLILFLLMFACVPLEKNTNIIFNQSYENSGFALLYSDDLYNDKLISKKLDDRSLILFQKNLKPKNNKSIIATIGPKAKYPKFYNSVISKRISEELEININQPYIKIVEINKNFTFVANKTKTFDEERIVAEKAPVEEIGIKDLSLKSQNKPLPVENLEFKYVIKIADFYYQETANLLKKRIKNELNLKNVKINELSKTEFRVYLGPYNNLISLKKVFNQILSLNFENIEIIKL